jgi:hypothetical protein
LQVGELFAHNLERSICQKSATGLTALKQPGRSGTAMPKALLRDSQLMVDLASFAGVLKQDCYAIVSFEEQPNFEP